MIYDWYSKFVLPTRLGRSYMKSESAGSPSLPYGDLNSSVTRFSVTFQYELSNTTYIHYLHKLTVFLSDTKRAFSARLDPMQYFLFSKKNSPPFGRRLQIYIIIF